MRLTCSCVAPGCTFALMSYHSLSIHAGPEICSEEGPNLRSGEAIPAGSPYADIRSLIIGTPLKAMRSGSLLPGPPVMFTANLAGAATGLTDATSNRGASGADCANAPCGAIAIRLAAAMARISLWWLLASLDVPGGQGVEPGCLFRQIIRAKGGMIGEGEAETQQQKWIFAMASRTNSQIGE